MAVNKSKADLLSQAATTLADNTTQAISPQDVREMAENLAESNFNKTTDNALVGLKAYDSGVIYKVSQGVNYNGSLYFANKDTTPGAFNTADWDLFAEQSNVIISGKKASAGTIAKGKPVYLVGFNNDLHTVEEANATAAGTTPVIGFTAEAFDASSSKSIITFGKLTGIDTSAFSVGNDLYLATSAGGLTTTRPTGGGSIVQRIAKVLKSHASTGEILIYNTARAAGLPNITTNKIWYGNASGQPEELGIGTGLTVTGGNLTAAGAGNFGNSDLQLTGDRNHELNSHKLIFRCKLTANADRIESFYDNSPVGGMIVDHYDKFGTKIHSINRDSFENAAYAVGYFRSGMDVGPKTAITMRGFSGTNSYIKFSNQFNDQYTQIGANVPHYFLKAAGALAANKFIVGNTSAIATEKISLQSSTLIKGEGTGTGITLALYDNDSTPNKKLEVLDNGQVNIDSSSGYLVTPFLIESYPFGGSGTKPFFKIKGYGEVEILGRLSNLFNVQNGAGAKQFEVLNGTTKINGAAQINATWFQVLTDTQKMSFNAGNGGALHHEIRTNGGGGPITTKFNIPGGSFQFIVGASAIIGTEKISLQGDTLINGTLDMNNNRITKAVINPSVQEAASSATFTINADEQSDGVLTAMAAATTIAAPTGTPVQSQSLVFRFKDDGTARGITWNAIFRAIGVTLPTTTTASKLLYVGCKYNSTDTKWDVVSVQEEA